MRNRSVGAMLSGVVARTLRPRGACPTTRSTSRSRAPPARASAHSSRVASRFELQGATNDYVGKGLSGGRIVVYPDPDMSGKARREHRHRQHGDVRRDRRRSVFSRRRRRAFLRAQFGRVGRRRGHRRSRLRVHDRRHRRRARPHRPQFRRRHERRHRLSSTTRTARSRSAAIRRW